MVTDQNICPEHRAGMQTCQGTPGRLKASQDYAQEKTGWFLVGNEGMRYMLKSIYRPLMPSFPTKK